MYIVSFYDEGPYEILCQSASLRWLIRTLEEKQLGYTVSSSEGKLKQEHFGFGDYEYWVETLFDQEI